MELFICLYVLIMHMYVHFLEIKYQSIKNAIHSWDLTPVETPVARSLQSRPPFGLAWLTLPTYIHTPGYIHCVRSPVTGMSFCTCTVVFVGFSLLMFFFGGGRWGCGGVWGGIIIFILFYFTCRSGLLGSAPVPVTSYGWLSGRLTWHSSRHGFISTTISK